jgi:hypothetical protein
MHVETAEQRRTVRGARSGQKEGICALLCSSLRPDNMLVRDMKRRTFLRTVTVGTTALNSLSAERLWAVAGQPELGQELTSDGDAGWREDWLARWKKNILGDSRNGYCDKETGEELGWLVSPFLNGFYYGFLATRDPQWLERLIDWTDRCVKRAVTEPDGCPGWPKGDGGGGESREFSADSLLGEAMLLRPVVLAAAEIRKNPGLQSKWGEKAQSYLSLAGRIFQKWDSRDCWREVKHGGVWVVPAYGIDSQTGKWSASYESRKTTGFSNPDNKQNHIACWLLAMYDVTREQVYRERASKWFELMKSRMKLREDDKYFVWNYWEPAGPWDYQATGSPKHWVGVHPNGGYYGIDVEGIVAGFEHGLVFNKSDIDRLIATNRDFMWNQQISGARFQRIDGGPPDPRWKNSPGVLWTALLPYDATLRRLFISNHNPEDWGGLSSTPWFLSLFRS